MRNPLRSILAERIRQRGPLRLDEYMRIALTDPLHGYYITRDPLGAGGDFTTAPEISQLFGEMIGVWIADCWDAMGRPRHLKIVELGPGRGTLMADILRTLKVAPAMLPEPYLVEASPALRAVQQRRVAGHWVDDLDEVPDGPMVLIANEFLDALPVRQFVRQQDGWHERMIGLSPDGETLTWTVSDGLAEGTAPAFEEAAPGTIAETAPDALALVRQIAARLSAQGGAALFIDYGSVESRTGDSLQAVRGHQYADPLDAPGEADLTAHVDFASLAAAARDSGAAVHGPVPQSLFLDAIGLFHRAQALKRNATQAQAREIDLGAHRLTAPDQMGTLFKVLAITDPSMPQPTGFAS
ncbi:SAM-dependent methyltransferase [Iodidimonas sp. SYSU 1G8]|uniref:class I SAM-dependent methyltransferase n=1 Tax=Iodidimonas sp. SYSU 1G8 TaxID=3133967 RepID=UPI0031FF134D